MPSTARTSGPGKAAGPAREPRLGRTAKAGKAGKAPKAPKKPGRLKQMARVYRMTKETDKRLGPVLLGVFLLTALVTFGLLFLLFPSIWWVSVLTALMAGILAAMVVFGRRAQKAQYAQIDGQPGAAAAALGQLRRGWKLDAAIAFNKNQDLVHRVVGPPGIVLVGEGNQNRLKALLANERRKHERVTSETPIHELVCGNGEGAVPVAKLTRHVTKLGRQLKPADMTDVLARLKALDANRSSLPIPKGPITGNLKGARQNMRGR